jgi:hypothetical protein
MGTEKREKKTGKTKSTERKVTVKRTSSISRKQEGKDSLDKGD